MYDVLADPDAARLDMASFMSKIPGLEQASTDGKLEYRDMKISSILIDDRESKLINGSRQYPMSFIRADNMSKVELVLPGSPEYNNSAPILLVTLSRELPFGVAAELSGKAETLNEYTVNPDAVAHLPAIGIGLSYDFGYSHNPALPERTFRRVEGSTQEPTAVESVETINEIRNRQRTHNLQLDLFRSFLDDRLDVNVTLATNGSDRKETTRTNTIKRASEQVVSEKSTSFLGQYNSPLRLSAGASVSYRWSKNGSVGLKYTMSHRESTEKGFTDWFQGVSDRLNHSITSLLEHNVSADVMYRHSPALSVKGVAGYMYRDYEVASEYWTGASTGMDYVQGVAYLTASVSGAFRKAGYSARASRPRQEMLTPTADISDPENIIVGNPELKGEVRHSVEVGLDQDFRTSWLKNISIDAFYSAVPNAIERLSTADDSGVRTTTYANIGKREEYGARLSLRFKITKYVSLSLNAKASKRSYSTRSGIENSYWTFSGMATARINLKYLTMMHTFTLMPSLSNAQPKITQCIRTGI